ncbi:MAG: YceI family protein [Catalinimonas sp.]
MRKVLSYSLLSASLLWAAGCADAPKGAEAEVGEAQEVAEAGSGAMTYQAVPSASSVMWVGTKPTGRHQGTFDVTDGTLEVEGGELVAGSFKMDLTSLTVTDEGMDEDSRMKLTGHLKSDDFFGVEANPEANFEITGVKPYEAGAMPQEDADDDDAEYRLENPTHMITGNLTMKGETKSVTFPASIEMADDEVTALAKFNIDRTQWGLNYMSDESLGDKLINKKVFLQIDLKARSASA